MCMTIFHSSFLRSARELCSWTRRKIASGSEAAPGQLPEAAAAEVVASAAQVGATSERERRSTKRQRKPGE